MITRERLVPLKIEDEGGQRIGGQVAQCEEKAPANSKYEPCSFRLFCFPFPPDPFPLICVGFSEAIWSGSAITMKRKRLR